MIKLLNTEKAVLRKDYRFDEAFSIFDEIGKNLMTIIWCLIEILIIIYKMLNYLRTIEDKVIHVFSTPSIAKK